MSESDSFLQEVSEEVRRDKLVQTLRKNAVWIGLGVAIILGGAIYFEWSKAQQTAKAQANGSALWDIVQTSDAAARAEATANLDLSTEAAPLAALQRAAAAVETGNLEEAVSGLQALAVDTSVDAALKDAVRLKLAAISDGVLENTERLDLLERLIVEGHALRPLALEQRAMIRLADNDLEGARADLSAIADDAFAPRNARVRADQVLTAIGAGTDAQDG